MLGGIGYTDVVRTVEDSLRNFQSWRNAVVGPVVEADVLGVVHTSVNGTSKGGKGNGNEQLPTPDSSPVLHGVVVNGGDGFEEGRGVHDGCDIGKALERLAEVYVLGEDVRGLELETELGYQVY